MSTVTEAGVPVPAANELYPKRFAYEKPPARELVAKFIEQRGGLGPVADDQKLKPGQEYFRNIVQQMQGAQEAGIFQV